ncbi:hypothetical protein ACFP3Q_09015 [Nocardioides sp. GCM10027113]|uniref:hypothetical protein n=1 Tax=unclassified Nocardioides TaxID=2615069 RepID=UPI00360F387F
MSALRDLDHARLRRAERTWLAQSAERLRRATADPARRTRPAADRGARNEGIAR